jgi:hypothetical protein
VAAFHQQMMHVGAHDELHMARVVPLPWPFHNQKNDNGLGNGALTAYNKIIRL